MLLDFHLFYFSKLLSPSYFTLFLLCIIIIVIIKHNIVSVINNIVDVISICPYKKLINKSIKEKPDNASIKYGNHVDANTNPNVNIPDIIGDSVKLDERIPKDIYAIDNNKNPNIDVKYVGISGV